MLKLRWRSLKELPLRVRGKSLEKDLAKTLDWIDATIILHNILVEQKEILRSVDCRRAFVAERPDTRPVIVTEDGKAFRNAKMKAALT
ncbi:hypothetical protein BGX21_006727, partial [Mortierella sp. AD011]